ncbi:increased rdna silencing protein [Moniliophthora roreri MCA 2997]|uniref:Increased rdna silencing protein n=2 Tax=Moniliophthora roreri TaxID=221103 RepID=V2XNW6_MONRO|nr:increased rdna silencing protein [Moniliophthora roreri MCA 2997]KAI3619113.1 increased rdna silencing protein [Moniliophthora roreri]
MSRVQSRVKAFESLGTGASVDLKDWNVLDDPPLINFQTDPPPLPPRKPSPSAPTPGSLTVQQQWQHTYPPQGSPRKGHAPASSISSFHSVSLSDDGKSSTADSQHTGVSESTSQTSFDDESFENVSPTSLTSPTLTAKQLALDWEKHIASNSSNNHYRPRPPKLPQRPPAKSASQYPPRSGPSSSSTSSNSAAPRINTALSSSSSSSTVILVSPASSVRRVPPPPVHGSLSSSTTSTSSFSTLSPPTRSSTLPSPTSPRPSLPHTSHSQPQQPYTPYLRRSPSNASLNSQQTIAKPKPPPPPIPKSKAQAGDISNLKLSQATTRRTPVPATARRRYELVFDENVRQSRRAKQQRHRARKKEGEKDLITLGDGEKPALLSPEAARKTRQAAGWRGLSIDLVIGSEDAARKDEDDEVEIWKPIASDERLPGCVVKVIWGWSRLGKEKLREIWTECDPSHTGSLDKTAFVTGMWRIDEELRRGQRSLPAPMVNTPRQQRPQARPQQQQVPIRPSSSPQSQVSISSSPTSSTSSFVSLGSSSYSNSNPPMSVSPSPSTGSSTGAFGSYVAVGRVNANGSTGPGPGSGTGAGAAGGGSVRRKPPPPPPPAPLGLPTRGV